MENATLSRMPQILVGEPKNRKEAIKYGDLCGLFRNNFVKFLMTVGILTLPILAGCQRNNGNTDRRQSGSPQRTEGGASETSSLQGQLRNCLLEKDAVADSLRGAQMNLAEANSRLEAADLTREISESVNAVFTKTEDLKYVPYLMALLQVLQNQSALIGIDIRQELDPNRDVTQIRDTLFQILGPNLDIQALVSNFATVVPKLPSALRDSIIQRMIADLPGFQEVLKRYDEFKAHAAHEEDVGLQWVTDQNSDQGEGQYQFVIKEGKPLDACLNLSTHDVFNELTHDAKAFFRFMRAAETRGMDLNIFPTGIAKMQEGFGLEGVHAQ